MTVTLAARYSVGTWDIFLHAYTAQEGVSKSFNLTRSELKTAIRELRGLLYSAHRKGNCAVGHDDNDWTVLVEKTSGMTIDQILESWRRY